MRGVILLSGTSDENGGALLLRARDNIAFAGKGVALLEPSAMWELNVSDHDIIEIMGRRTTLAVAISTHYSPVISGAIAALEELEDEASYVKGMLPGIERGIWLDMVIRENARIRAGDLVKVRRRFAWNGIYLAQRIMLTPRREEVKVDPMKLAEWLHGVPVTVGDLVFWYDMELITREYKGSLYKVTKLAPAAPQRLMIFKYTGITIDRKI